MATSYDYDTILNNLKTNVLAKLSGKGKYSDMLMFSTNSAILEACAEELADIVMYNEFLSREVVWNTAQSYSSLMHQVDFFGYVPHRKIGAKGQLIVSASKTFNSNHSVSLDIPKFSVFEGAGLSFASDRLITLQNTASNVRVPIVQGEVKTLNKLIDDVTSEYVTITFDEPNIENGVYEVWINYQNGGTELCKELTHIRLAKNNIDSVFTIKNTPNFSGVTLTFGNGIFGKRVNSGDEVVLKYLDTKGDKGNILAKNIIKGEIEIAGVTLYYTNDSYVAGGTDYETLEETRALAPLYFRTNQRAVTREDYMALINNIGSISKLQVWGEKEINEDNGNPSGTYIPTNENVVHITGITKIQGKPANFQEALKQKIRETLDDKKGLTDIVQFQPTKIVFVAFNIIAYYNKLKFSNEEIASNIKIALNQDYGVDKMEYKQSIYYSDYYTTIDRAIGVNHHTTNFKLNEYTYFANTWSFSTDLEMRNIVKDSFKIYYRFKDEEERLLATSDETGKLIGGFIVDGEPGRFSIHGKLNYTTGEMGEVVIDEFEHEDEYTSYVLRLEFDVEETSKGIKDILVDKRHMLAVVEEERVNILAKEM